MPAGTFGFFDIRDAKYKTITTKPIEITVTKGTGKPQKPITDAGTKPKANFLVRFFDNRLRVVSLFAVLIIIGLIVWLKRDTKKEKQLAEAAIMKKEKVDSEKPVEEIIQAQENPLALTERCMLREDDNFYSQLNLELKHYLSKKLSISTEVLNRKNIAEQLDAKGISNETAMQLQQLMNEIEWQLYTPFVDNAKMREMYERAHDLIQLINTYHS